MKKVSFNKVAIAIGISAISIGGLLSAAFAHAPSQFMMWCVAYLVLVVGVAQVVIGKLATRLHKGVKPWQAWLAVVSYNVASLTIIFGRWLKDTLEGPAQSLVVSGILVFMLSLSLIMAIVKMANKQHAIVFYVVTSILLVSAPIGIILTLK